MGVSAGSELLSNLTISGALGAAKRQPRRRSTSQVVDFSAFCSGISVAVSLRRQIPRCSTAKRRAWALNRG